MTPPHPGDVNRKPPERIDKFPSSRSYRVHNAKTKHQKASSEIIPIAIQGNPTGASCKEDLKKRENNIIQIQERPQISNHQGYYNLA